MYVLLDPDTRRRLDALCQLGARPRIISAMLPSLSETPSVINMHWRHYQGKAPKRGSATSRPTSFHSTSRVRLHSSFALSAYFHVEETGIHFVDAYIESYQIYSNTFADDEPESFDWFWSLVQNALDGHLTLVTCSNCGFKYLHNTDDLVNDRNCPVTRFIKPPKEEEGVSKQNILTSSPFIPSKGDCRLQAAGEFGKLHLPCQP